MQTENTYDPSDVTQYFGSTFVTEVGSRYEISGKGKLSVRPSIESADVMLIAGVEAKFYGEIIDSLDKTSHDKKNLDSLILRYGKMPAAGLHLVVSLTPKSAQQKDRYGLITSIIDRIE